MLSVKALLLLLLSIRGEALPGTRCPPASAIPQLTIQDLTTTGGVPVYDKWQVYLGEIPLSDMQVATWSGESQAINKVGDEMASRGFWTFAGLAIGALGTGTSSTGWALFGQEKTSTLISLPLALG